MVKKRGTNKRRAAAKKTTDGQKRGRSFYETRMIVDILCRVGRFDEDSPRLLDPIDPIRTTEMLGGHDEIIAAIEEGEKEGLGALFPHGVLRKVKNNLREQKRLAEEITAREKQIEKVMDDLMKKLENWQIKING